MAIAVISGLIAWTVLTLVIIPTIYELVDRLQARLLGQREEQPAREPSGLPAEVALPAGGSK